MLAIVRGLLLAFVAFNGAFVLHIVGGATGQGWLFALAVALIFLSATGFPAFALLFAGHTGRSARRSLVVLGSVAGFALTMAALWAANSRASEAWQVPVALLAEGAGSALVLALARLPLSAARATFAAR